MASGEQSTDEASSLLRARIKSDAKSLNTGVSLLVVVGSGLLLGGAWFTWGWSGIAMVVGAIMLHVASSWAQLVQRMMSL